MNIWAIIRLIACACLICGFDLTASAQTNPVGNPKVLRVQYNAVYQLEDSYTIIYDNTAQATKLKDFRVTFYGPGRRTLAETETETHPLTGKIETYRLIAPITGFNEVELSILSLHSGEIDAFPTNIGAILALNELTEVPEPEVMKPKPKDTAPKAETTPAVQAQPSLTDDEKQRVTETALASVQLISALREKSAQFSLRAESQTLAVKRLEQLILSINSLLERTESPALTDLKPQINSLSSDIGLAKIETDIRDERTELDRFQTKALDLQSQVEALQILTETEGADISNVMSSLTDIETMLGSLNTAIAAIDLPNTVTPEKIETWNISYLVLKAKIDESPSPTFNWRTLIGGVLVGFVVLGFGAKVLLSTKTKSRPPKSTLNRIDPSGVLFPASPMLAGNVAAPLAPVGQLTAAQLQMLSGQYAVLREAYQATGRIGYEQVGIPTSEDYAFGTGFLISDRHVMTNRHVHGLYGHYLLDKTDPGGIEFIAEKNKDASDFVPFKSQPPLLLPGLDIAIYTLLRPVTDRSPIQLKPIDIEDLHTREIVVIGYPDTHTPENPEVLAVVEEDAVFAVKRISQGRIFRHSTDTDTPFGVETSVSENKTSKFLMPAICHNASTMGGNSGSPLLDIKTGYLVGVHFAGFKVFNRQEAANLAMAIAQLTQSNQLKSVSGVTAITDKNTNYA